MLLDDVLCNKLRFIPITIYDTGNNITNDGILSYAQNAAKDYNKGFIVLEELYDLSSEELNSLYKKYNKEYEGKGLIPEKKDESVLELKLEAIKHVYEYKEEIRKENEERMKKQETKKRLMEAIKEKEMQSLKNMSKEDLEKMLNDF